MANLFGTLNRFISRLDSDPRDAQHNHSSPPLTTGYGFQVLRNSDSNLLLEPWFDFIIGINGRTIDNPSADLFATEIRNCAGSTISLGVYCARGSLIREMYLSVPRDNPSLGLALQWSSLSTVENVWHILDVIPNSPADVAGLLPYSDYVIGSSESSDLRGESSFGDLVEQYMNRPLRIFVYNNEYDVTRMVTITPAKNWGGEGALGCVLGYGALHQVPAPLTEPAQAPGETLFESGITAQSQHLSSDPPSEQNGQPLNTSAGADFLVPAEMQFNNPSPPPPPSGPPPTGRAKKARAHHPAPAAGLDDYFAEGEQKSRELEGGGSTPRPNGSLPPPPKSSQGPPKAASPAPPAAEAEA